MISDIPIENNDQDKLNRKRFVNAIIEEIRSLNDNNCFVIGLYGNWGSGKTSIINLIHNKLNAIGYFTSYFNPWRYKSEEILLSELFLKIVKGVNFDNALKSRTNELGEKLKKYSKFINFPKISFWGIEADVSVAAKSITEFIGEILDEEESLEKNKQKINDILNNLAVPLVIFIDDVDRLDNSEIQQLFKLLKLTVDFKNIVYFLAFDEEIVAKSLSETYGNNLNDGKRFLEKIIQLPIRIPLIDENRKFDYTIELLSNWLKNKEIKIDNKSTIASNFMQNFKAIHKSIISTPRDSKRLVNAVSFSEASLRGEINIYDLIFLESIRLFMPKLFEFIISNIEIFYSKSTSIQSHRNSIKNKDELTSKYNSICKFYNLDQFDLDQIIDFVFAYNELTNNDFYDGMEGFKERHTNQRIGIRTYMHRYLEYKLGDQDISDTEFSSILEKFNSTTKFDELKEEISVFSKYPKDYLEKKFYLSEKRLTQVGIINTCKMYGTINHFYGKPTIDDKFFQKDIRLLLEKLSKLDSESIKIEVLNFIFEENINVNYLTKLLSRCRSGFKNEFKEIVFQIKSTKALDKLEEKIIKRIVNSDFKSLVENTEYDDNFLVYDLLIKNMGIEKFKEKSQNYMKNSMDNFFTFVKSSIIPVYIGLTMAKSYSNLKEENLKSIFEYVNIEFLKQQLEDYLNLIPKDFSDENLEGFNLVDNQIAISLLKYISTKESDEKTTANK